MNDAALRKELTRLHRLIREAGKKAAAQRVLIDKLTAAQLHIEVLMQRLRKGR